MPNPPQITPINQWHSRGYIPHCDFEGLHQSVTFRLIDSLPRKKLIELEQQLTQETSQHQKMVFGNVNTGIDSSALKNIIRMSLITFTTIP